MQLESRDGLPFAQFEVTTEGLAANMFYFSHPKWMANWLDNVHRYPELKDRWLAGAGSWDDRIIVDIGCGPGNLFATIGGRPAMLIGVDVAEGSLRIAEKLGYTPLLADAQDLPLADGIADLVTMNATLHHCDDIVRILSEAARITKPGGKIVIDHDPQTSAWAFKGLAKFAFEARKPIYRLLKRGGHSSEEDEQRWAIASEIHHRIGQGVSREVLVETLAPLGFDVKVWPHNLYVGRQIMVGARGVAALKYRVAQKLSGINTRSPGAAISLLCIATKKPTQPGRI